MTVCGQLKEMVNNYLESHPNISINGLAKRSGVGATTIRRIINGSIKSEPAPHTILNLVSVITKEKRLAIILERSEGPIKNILQMTFGIYATESMPHTYDKNLDRALSHPQKFIIYKLAANRVGTSKDEIRENFGNNGLHFLEQLLEYGLLEEVNERIHAVKKDFALDPDVLVRNIPELLKFYKSHEIDKGQNFLFSMSESLNFEAIKKIKDIQKDALKKIYNIVNSPYYEGEIPFFLVSCQDTLSGNTSHGVYQ
ncbi:MAG: helix-turn-helix domain-containing protein [Bdellovibrionales bacterium]|nr:helix-turn-helix domain-containing protein [Bdellovibrionales bacterium]